MNLNEIETQWKDYDRKLDTVLHLNARLLNVDALTRASTALSRQRHWAIAGAMTNAMLIPLVSLLIALKHLELAFVVPAVVVDVYCLINLLVHGRQARLLSRIDYASPVVTIQRRIDDVVKLRIRLARWLASSVVLMWVPISIVAFKALLGWNLYAIAPGWLILNTALGLSCIPLVRWLSRDVDRGVLSASAQGFLRGIAGENLTAASTFLSALSDFEHEDKSPD